MMTGQKWVKGVRRRRAGAAEVIVHDMWKLSPSTDWEAVVALTIRECGAEAPEQVARIPIRFEVKSALRVEAVEGGLGGLLLREERVDQPYVKDYDADPPEDERRVRWADRYDVSNWGFLLAYDGDEVVGAATVAHRSRGLDMLEGRTDLAVLWDIRVKPGRRGKGIGTQLFRRAADWARERGCGELKVETQNINVPACRFYAGQGCRLGAIHRRAYRKEHIAHETMLLWHLDL